MSKSDAKREREQVCLKKEFYLLNEVHSQKLFNNNINDVYNNNNNGKDLLFSDNFYTFEVNVHQEKDVVCFYLQLFDHQVFCC